MSAHLGKGVLGLYLCRNFVLAVAGDAGECYGGV